MKRRIFSTLALLCFTACLSPVFGQQTRQSTIVIGKTRELGNGPENPAGISAEFNNPLKKGADPFMIKHDGLYYTVENSRRGFKVTESRFITRPEREAQVWVAPASGPDAFQHWAPEIHPINGKWYIYFAGSDLNNGQFRNQRTTVLESDSPFGPFESKGVIYTGDDPAHETGNRWAIDMTILEHKGKLYAIWSGWANEHDNHNVNQNLYVAEMENPWTIKGTRVLLAKPELPWEKGDHIRLLEGPQILKHKNDVFILYSTRGSWTEHYKMGMLKLASPDADPLDPASWIKNSEPIFQGTETVHGVGHATLVQSPDDKEYWVYYHSKRALDGGWGNREVFLQKFGFDRKGNPVFGEPKGSGPMKRPSGEVAIEKADFKNR